MDRELKRHLQDLNYPEAFTSTSALVKKFGRKYGAEKIKEWSRGQDLLTKFGVIRKRFRRNPVLAHEPDSIYSADLADLQKYSAQNRQFKYALVVVDSFTRRVWAFPLKNKKPTSTIEAFQKLFKTNKPKIAIHTDLGENKSTLKCVLS